MQKVIIVNRLKDAIQLSDEISKTKIYMIDSMNDLPFLSNDIKCKVIEEFNDKFSFSGISESFFLQSPYLDLRSIDESVFHTKKDIQEFIPEPLFETKTIDETINILDKLRDSRTYIVEKISFNPFSVIP